MQRSVFFRGALPGIPTYVGNSLYSHVLQTFWKYLLLLKSSAVRSGLLKTCIFIYIYIYEIRFFLIYPLKFFQTLLFYLFPGKGWNMRGNVTEGCHAALKNIFHHGNSCLKPKSKLTEVTRKTLCCWWTWFHDTHMEDFCMHKEAVDSFDCNWADYSQQKINLLLDSVCNIV